MDMREVFKLAEAKMSNREHYRQVMNRVGRSMPAIDPDEYPPIKGMEGPFRYRSGHILYYDPKEGKYYDRKSDMYLSNRDAEKIVMEGDLDGVDEACNKRKRMRSHGKGKGMGRGDGEGPIGVPTQKVRGFRKKSQDQDMAEDLFLDSFETMMGYSDDDEMPEMVPDEPQVVGDMGQLFEYLDSDDEPMDESWTVQDPEVKRKLQDGIKAPHVMVSDGPASRTYDVEVRPDGKIKLYVDVTQFQGDNFTAYSKGMRRKAFTIKPLKAQGSMAEILSAINAWIAPHVSESWIDRIGGSWLQEAVASVPMPMGGVMGMNGLPDMYEATKTDNGKPIYDSEHPEFPYAEEACYSEGLKAGAAGERKSSPYKYKPYKAAWLDGYADGAKSSKR